MPLTAIAVLILEDPFTRSIFIPPVVLLEIIYIVSSSTRRSTGRTEFISGFFRKLPTGHLIVPKVELIRTPATKRHRDGEEEDEMAEPVEDMDVDEMEACQCLPGQQDFSTSVQ